MQSKRVDLSQRALELDFDKFAKANIEGMYRFDPVDILAQLLQIHLLSHVSSNLLGEHHFK